jgi:hypothetical protein
MGRGGSRVSVQRSKAADYRTVADSFYNGAEVAAAFNYWNAAGVLYVHAAIALADSMAIKLGGVRCRGEDHHEAVALLDELVASSQQNKKPSTNFAQLSITKTWLLIAARCSIAAMLTSLLNCSTVFEDGRSAFWKADNYERLIKSLGHRFSNLHVMK